MEILLEMKKVGMMVNSSIGYTISEAIKSMGKQKKMTSASIIIMVATMFMFGIFYVIGENINYVMVQIESEQGMQVNILDDATNEQIEELGNNIRKIEGVNNVTFRSKEDALATMKETLGEHQDLLESYVNIGNLSDIYVKEPVINMLSISNSAPNFILHPTHVPSDILSL